MLIRLTEWARREGITYADAYKMAKDGQIPGLYQTPKGDSGRLRVDVPSAHGNSMVARRAAANPQQPVLDPTHYTASCPSCGHLFLCHEVGKRGKPKDYCSDNCRMAGATWSRFEVAFRAVLPAMTIERLFQWRGLLTGIGGERAWNAGVTGKMTRNDAVVREQAMEQAKIAAAIEVAKANRNPAYLFPIKERVEKQKHRYVAADDPNAKPEISKRGGVPIGSRWKVGDKVAVPKRPPGRPKGVKDTKPRARKGRKPKA